MPVADSSQPTVPSAPPRAALESVRSGLPPQTLDAYLGEWETFFDEYATVIDRWHHRAGYHQAVASLGRFQVLLPSASDVVSSSRRAYDR